MLKIKKPYFKAYTIGYRFAFFDLIHTLGLAMQVNKNKISFDEIVSPLKDYLLELDSFLNDQVRFFEPEVREQVQYVLSHSGKRLRPILVAYSAGQITEKKQKELIRLGAILELVHLATLVHDDILDDATKRHGQQTASVKYGKDAAVLIGDVLFAHALALASEFDTTEICKAVAVATSRVCSGEISQTYSKNKLNFSRKHYYRIIDLKTAELFALACKLGAKISGKQNIYMDALSEYGHNLGCAYQIFDDVIDLFSNEEKAGKTLGTDLANGKITLPVIILLEGMSQDIRAEWEKNFYNNRDSAISFLKSELSNSAVIDKIKSEFNEAVTKTYQSLESINKKDPLVAKNLHKIVEFLDYQFSSLC